MKDYKTKMQNSKWYKDLMDKLNTDIVGSKIDTLKLQLSYLIAEKRYYETPEPSKKDSEALSKIYKKMHLHVIKDIFSIGFLSWLCFVALEIVRARSNVASLSTIVNFKDTMINIIVSNAIGVGVITSLFAITESKKLIDFALTRKKYANYAKEVKELKDRQLQESKVKERAKAEAIAAHDIYKKRANDTYNLENKKTAISELVSVYDSSTYFDRMRAASERQNQNKRNSHIRVKKKPTRYQNLKSKY